MLRVASSSSFFVRLLSFRHPPYFDRFGLAYLLKTSPALSGLVVAGRLFHHLLLQIDKSTRRSLDLNC